MWSNIFTKFGYSGHKYHKIKADEDDSTVECVEPVAPLNIDGFDFDPSPDMSCDQYMTHMLTVFLKVALLTSVVGATGIYVVFIAKLVGKSIL